MEWLSQNWIFLLLVAVGLGLFMRRRGGFGFSGSHHGGISQSHDEAARHDDSRPVALASNVDPVSGKAVDLTTALSSAYQGIIYYFETRENRDRFEASPQQYAAKAPIGNDQHEHRQHRHGC